MAQSVVVKFNPKFTSQIMSIANIAIRDTVKELRDITRAKLSTPFPPPSLPGNPPHKRTGGLRRAIFASRVANADWAFGVNRMSDPRKNHLGIWMELGTGVYREPYPPGWSGSLTGTGNPPTSVKPRPYLMKTFLNEGPFILRRNLGKAGRLGRGL